MTLSEQFRSKAAAYAERAKQSKSLKDIRDFTQAARSNITLAENEEWLARNAGKLVSTGRPGKTA
jgi:hypothetical protein